ncbi:MAG: serine hydrolase [Chitinophagales bacterium]
MSYPLCPYGIYTIGPGDTLFALAQRSGTTVQEWLAANPGIVPTNLQVGQVICLPPPPVPPPAGVPAPDLSPLRRQIEAYLATQAATYRVYFQDLRSGAAFGIGETEQMVAASTTKVPTVLYLYTLAASRQIDLNEKVAYQAADFQSGAGALQAYVHEGDLYTLDCLADLAIRLSDNIAHRMLLRRLGLSNVAAFMRSLGGQVVYPNGSNITTALDLATYMRAVVAFARRQPDLGGLLLAQLENTIWNAGLNGQLPTNVVTAHKEGDVTGVSNDYGVVFALRPYLLVVLSANQPDAEAGFQFIAHISRLAYDFEQSLTAAH